MNDGKTHARGIVRRYFCAVIAAVLASASASAATLGANFTSATTVPLTTASYTAAGNSVSFNLGFAPATGSELTVAKITGLGFIQGKFTNLAQGQHVSLIYAGIAYPFVADYFGGSGNDLVLQWGYQELAGWGSTENGRLGGGAIAYAGGKPALVDLDPLLIGKTISKIETGAATSLVLRGDGKIVAFGDNRSGQLGIGGTAGQPGAVLVDQSGVLAGKEVAGFAAGISTCFAVCTEGTVAGWGANSFGILGNGATADSYVPVMVTATGALAGKKVVAVSAGGGHALALCSDGTVVAWGLNSSGQLGNGGTANSPVPVIVPKTGALAGKSVVAVQAGEKHSLALCSDGTIAAWGGNLHGELGAASGLPMSTTPVQVVKSGVLAGRPVVVLRSRGGFSLVRCTDGTLATWGINETGNLGDGTKTDRSAPVLVKRDGALAGKTVASLAAGFGHCLVVCTDGTLVGWGNNYANVLGNPEVPDSPIPLALADRGILDGKKTGRISAGGAFNLAIAGVPLSPDTRLESLALSAGVLDSGAGEGLTNLAWSVPAGTTLVHFTPTLANAQASLKVNGTALASGTQSPAIPLTSGGAIITMQVKAENGAFLTVTITVATPLPLQVTFTSAAGPAADFPALAAAGLTANLALDFAPAPGTDLTVARISGRAFILGEYANLADGQLVTLNYSGVAYRFVTDYHGGDGNDLVLRWTPRELTAWGANLNGSRTGLPLPVALPLNGALAGKIVDSVASGDRFTLALNSDGTIAGLGLNSNGQLGPAGAGYVAVPVEIPLGGLAGKRVVAIDAGDQFGLALCADGTVGAWGRNENGQLGIGSLIGTNTPMAVAGALAGKSVVAIAAGANHALALCADGSVAAWGKNNSGQLGNGTSDDSPVPVLIDRSGVLAGKRVISIAAGEDFSLALCSDGAIAGWGTNSQGQLGNTAGAPGNVPVLIDASGGLAGKSVTAISAGNDFALALLSDGNVASWGANTSGQLGNPGNGALPALVNTAGILAGKIVTSIEAGYNFAFAICADGTVAAWGGGVLGVQVPSSSPTPVDVTGSGNFAGRKVLSVSAGKSHALAIFAGPPSTQLASLTVAGGSFTTPFLAGLTEYIVTAADAPAALVITPTASESSPISINGASAATDAPFAISAPAGTSTITIRVGTQTRFTDYRLTVVVGGRLTIGLNTPGAPFVTGGGFDFSGLAVDFSLGFAPEMGVGLRIAENTGRDFIGGKFTDLAQGQSVVLAYCGKVYRYVANYYGGTGNDLVLEWANRSVLAWGRGTSGELGTGVMASSSLPQTVASGGFLAGKSPIAVSSGDTHSVALCADGSVAVWGSGPRGQLGAGAVAQSLIPISLDRSGVLEGKTVIAISSSNLSNLALCADGTLAAWGYGPSGQFGNGSIIDALSPVLVMRTGVLAGKSIVGISMGGTHALALCSDGSIASWGLNSRGQLGNGTTTNSTEPVLVTATGALAGKSVVQVAAGYDDSLAVCSDGTVIGWGNNQYGQLGSSLPSTVLLPASLSDKILPADKKVVALSQGAHSTTVARCADGTGIAFGQNTLGQQGGLTAIRPSPGALDGKFVTHVGSGFAHTIACCSDGTAIAWGYNIYGQIGDGTATTRSTPVPVSTAGPLGGKRALFGSGATHTLLVVAAPDTGFGTWADRFADLSDRTTTGDPDGDGISNLLEYVLQGNPAISSAAILPAASADGTNLVFQFTRAAGSPADTTQIFETSENLVDWTPLALTGPGAILGNVRNDGGQSVTITVPRDGRRRVFGRLAVGRP